MELIDAVPSQSLLIVESEDIKYLDENTVAISDWSSLYQTPLFNIIKKDFEQLQFDFLNRSDSAVYIKPIKFVAALQKSSAKGSDFLYVFEKDDLNIDLELLQKDQSIKVNPSIYLKEKVYEVVQKEQGFAVCIYKNIVLVARYPFIVEDAIAQLINPRNPLKKYLLRNSASKEQESNPEMSIYFAFGNLFKYFQLPIFKNSVNPFENSNAFIELNFFPSRDKTQVKGTYYGDLVFDTKKVSKPLSESTLFEVIPDNCSYLYFQSIDLKTNDENQLKNDSIFKKYMQPWVGNHMALFAMESRKDAFEKTQIRAIELKDVELAEQMLEQFAASKGKLQEIDYQSFKIKQLLSNELLDFSFFDKFQFDENPFYVIIKDYVIFSNSRNTLELLIDKYILSQTLLNDPGFLQFQATLHPEIYSFFYCKPTLFIPHLRQVLHAFEANKTEPYFDVFNGFDVIGIQTNNDKKHNLNFYLNTSSNSSNETKIVWKSNLKNEAIIPPAVIKNEENGQLEIFVQDSKNIIYLFDRNGVLLWERVLKSKIYRKFIKLNITKVENRK